MRLFSGIINRGDSFRRRRSRSNSLCPPAVGSGMPSLLMNEAEHTVPVCNYNVALLGANGVGKTALISQFMTSECINAYDRQKGKMLQIYLIPRRGFLKRVLYHLSNLNFRSSEKCQSAHYGTNKLLFPAI